VRGAASALDQLGAEASTALIKIVLELARAGHFEALKRARTRICPQRRRIRKGDHERRLRALEEASYDRAHPPRSFKWRSAPSRLFAAPSSEGAEAILMKFMKFTRNGRQCRCHKDFGRFLMKRCFSALLAPEILARLASLARNRVGFSRRGVSSDSSRAAIFLFGG
jgi:hypothetical protein